MKAKDGTAKMSCKYCPASFFTLASSPIKDWPDSQEQPTPHAPILISKPGSKASRQDISKFMKHSGRQLPSYRKSIKAKKKPEED
jgi:hypothetical protein